MVGERAAMKLDHDQAVDAAQQFLGDLGIISTSDPAHALATDDLVIIRFRTAAEALEAGSVVLVDRATGHCRFATVRPDDPDPWPGARPMD